MSVTTTFSQTNFHKYDLTGSLKIAADENTQTKTDTKSVFVSVSVCVSMFSCTLSHGHTVKLVDITSPINLRSPKIREATIHVSGL